MTPTRSVVSLAIVVLLSSGCGDGGAAQKRGETADAPLVEAVPARSGAVPLTERVTGTVKARNQVEIRAEVESPIVEVYARGGEAVREGQPLVRHRDDELRDQLRRAEADVQVAEAAARQQSARVSELEAQVRRTRNLAREQLVSAADLETLEAQLAAARAAADEATARIAQARAVASERRAALARAVVRAPVSGWIGLRNAEVGMLPRANALLFVIGDLRRVIVEIPLTQEMLRTIEPGAAVTIDPGGEGESMRGTIARVSPFLAPSSRSTVAEIDVDNAQGRLRPGMSVNVDVAYGRSATATLVPLSALYEDPRSGSVSVFVAAEMNARAAADQVRPVAMRAVNVIARGGGAAAVSDVREGEWVVSIGQHLLARDDARTARVRPATWERVLELQGLQREDLLAEFMAKQQTIARTAGAEPPPSSQYLGGSSTP